MAKISIIGAGSWGTALGLLLCNNGHDVTICSENEKEIESLKEHREHLTKLPGVRLPDEMKFTCDVRGSLSGQDILVMAKASPYVRTTCKKYAADIPDGQLIVNVAKGVEADTLMTMSQIIEEEVPGANVVVLSGPSHAEEVGRGLPTTIVVGAHDRESALYVQNVFMSPVFRVYTSPDITGIELGGALKNVIALAAGTADGLGYGDNTKAALITRGIAEIARLGTAMGAHAETFYGLSGIGDLIVTCASVHSRNRKAGYLIVYDPYAELIHYESKSRGYEDTEEKIERFNREIKLFQTRWKKILENGDPYYSPNLTLDHNDFGLNHLAKVERR